MTNLCPARRLKVRVKLKISNARLQLVFRVAGKRYYLSTGLADTPLNRQLAERKASLIEDDIFKERFDPTLEKYKPQPALEAVTPKIAPKAELPKTSLIELWEKYTEFQQAHLEQTTIIRDYGKIEKRIQKFPKPFLEDAIDPIMASEKLLSRNFKKDTETTQRLLELGNSQTASDRESVQGTGARNQNSEEKQGVSQTVHSELCCCNYFGV